MTCPSVIDLSPTEFVDLEPADFITIFESNDREDKYESFEIIPPSPGAMDFGMIRAKLKVPIYGTGQ